MDSCSGDTDKRKKGGEGVGERSTSLGPSRPTIRLCTTPALSGKTVIIPGKRVVSTPSCDSLRRLADACCVGFCAVAASDSVSDVLPAFTTASK